VILLQQYADGRNLAKAFAATASLIEKQEGDNSKGYMAAREASRVFETLKEVGLQFAKDKLKEIAKKNGIKSIPYARQLIDELYQLKREPIKSKKIRNYYSRVRGSPSPDSDSNSWDNTVRTVEGG